MLLILVCATSDDKGVINYALNIGLCHIRWQGSNYAFNIGLCHIRWQGNNNLCF